MKSKITNSIREQPYFLEINTEVFRGKGYKVYNSPTTGSEKNYVYTYDKKKILRCSKLKLQRPD